MVGEEVLLYLLGQFERVDQFEAVSQPIDHMVGMAGNDTEFILGCNGYLGGKISLADLFQDPCLIVEKKFQVARVGEDEVDNQNHEHRHDEQHLGGDRELCCTDRFFVLRRLGQPIDILRKNQDEDERDKDRCGNCNEGESAGNGKKPFRQGGSSLFLRCFEDYFLLLGQGGVETDKKAGNNAADEHGSDTGKGDSVDKKVINVYENSSRKAE